MPDCHRCDRTFASGELRRTPKGHVCKDAIACKRRLTLTRRPAVDAALADRLALNADSFDKHVDGHDPLVLLRIVDVINTTLADVAMDIVQRAARETKLTQKQLADALGVPPSTLAGLKQSVK